MAAEPVHAPRSESAFQDDVRANLFRNYMAHLCHGLFGQTGFRLIQAPTFIPAYLFLLSGSELVVGLARGLQSLGQCLTPLLSATLIEHRRRVLPLGFLVGGAMRLQVLGIALAGFFLAGIWNLAFTCLFLGLFGFFMGMQGVIFNFLMSKVIPVERRGTLLGLRNFLAGLTSSAVAMLGGTWLVETNALGNGYAATFLLAFALTSVGLLMLGFIREPETPEVRSRSKVAARLAALPALMRRDRDYAAYIVTRAVATLGLRMATPYLVLYAGTLEGAELGTLTAAFLLSQTSTNLAWGVIADRTGFRAIFLASIVVWTLAVVGIMAASGFAAIVAVFVGVGAGMGGFQMSAQNLVLEFGTRRNLPMRIAAANSTSEFMGAIGPVLGGLLLWVGSYTALFTIAIGFQLAGLVLMLFFVREPRHRLRRGEQIAD